MSDIDVLKFGGSTFGEPADYVSLGKALRDRQRTTGRRLVVVVSAMAGETETLRTRLQAVCPDPPKTVRDELLPHADTVGAQLLAAALIGLGVPAAYLAGRCTGFVAAKPLGRGKLSAIDGGVLMDSLRDVSAVVLPGGQAVDEYGRQVWLGKNSSDVSAVAAAVAVGARYCEVYSDVDGVYSCDPHVVPGSQRFGSLAYSSAEMLAAFGAKVLHREAIAYARANGVRIRCHANRPPYQSGSVIGATGEQINAVVLNARSEVRRFEDTTVALQAVSALTDAGIEAFTHPSLGPRFVLVVGCYIDIGTPLRGHDLPPGEFVGVPVIDIAGDSVRIDLLPSVDAAVEHARDLHRANIA